MVVVILEDLDLFSEDREGVVDQLRLGALMNILDGVNSVKNAVTVATTNRLELIEKALSNRPGRFDRVVEVPALEEPLRAKMVHSRLAGCSIEPSLVNKIIKKTDGWTPAELQELINTINLYFINLNQENERIITQEVVDNVFNVMNKYCVGRNNKGKKMGFDTEE